MRSSLELNINQENFNVAKKTRPETNPEFATLCVPSDTLILFHSAHDIFVRQVLGRQNRPKTNFIQNISIFLLVYIYAKNKTSNLKHLGIQKYTYYIENIT